MYQSLPSITQSTSIQFKFNWVASILLLFSVILTPVSATSFKLANFELSGIVINSPDSLAVLFDKEKRSELVLRVGDVVAGCVLDYIRRNRVNFYCNDQLQTLTLRSLSNETATNLNKNVWLPPISIPEKQRVQLFDQPADFIVAFNLVPHMQDGQLSAFEIKSVPEDSDVSTMLGLHIGDLIVAVNGVPATDHAEFSKAFEQIKYTQSVDIELIRDEVRYFKSYLLQR